jgi:hypothetical protein
MTYTFELKTADGDDAGPFTTSEGTWQPGDEFIGQGNTRGRIRAIAPLPVIEEFVLGVPLSGIWEVELAGS